jgi:hypothetical protein
MLRVLAATCLLASGPVIRWSTPVPIEAEDISYTDNGVVIRPIDEILPITIPWYDIRSIPGGWTGETAPHRETAQLARTARQRRLRGDLHGASELYEQLDQKLQSTRSEQSLDIAIGLFQQHLHAQQINPESIQAWLSVLRAGGYRSETTINLLDARTGLHPALIPLSSMPTAGSSESFEGFDAREQILAEYYAIALTAASSEEIDSSLKDLEIRTKKLGDRDTGLSLVHEIVAATLGHDPQLRVAAREQLERNIRSSDDGWVIDWCRLAMGASLLAEQDPSEHERGVVACIRVIVDPSEGTPNSIRILAARIATEYLKSTNREEYADTIMMAALMVHEPTRGTDQ